MPNVERLVPEDFANRFSKKLKEIDDLAIQVREAVSRMTPEEKAEIRDADVPTTARHSLEQEGIKVPPEVAIEQYVNGSVPGIPPETRKALEGHYSADLLVRRWVERHKTLNVDGLLDIHGVLMGRVQPDIAGKFRDRRAVRPGLPDGFRFPDPQDVPTHLNGFMGRLEKSGDHPVLKAVFTQLAVYRIHAFGDGNSRTSRLAQNMLLLQDGYLPAVVPEGLYVQHRKHLNAALEPGWGEKKAGFFDFMLDMEKRALETFVRTHVKTGPLKDDGIIKNER